MLVTDSAGLGIFSACGVRTVLEMGFDDNLYLVIFAAVLPAVGGGVLRDLFAGERPYIFVKHIYACAAIAGAFLCYYLWDVLGHESSIIVSSAFVFIIRICAAHFRWSLPKVHRRGYTVRSVLLCRSEVILQFCKHKVPKSLNNRKMYCNENRCVL